VSTDEQPAQTHPLRAYRDRHQLSQPDLANRLGIPVSYVRAVEGGHRKPSVSRCKLIEKMLGGEVTRYVLRRDIYDGDRRGRRA